MPATDEPIHQGDGTLSSDGDQDGLETLRTDTQNDQHPINKKRLESIAYDLLVEIGENPNREGLRETPRRFANWWAEFINYDPGTINTVFESVCTSQLVIVSGIDVWSLCEHHLLPFCASVSIAYIPDKKVIGLSKFGRIASAAAHKLQIQERMTQQIAQEVMKLARTPDVGVITRGVHLCMMMRGIKSAAVMTTSEFNGEFNDHSVRDEFVRVALSHNPMSF